MCKIDIDGFRCVIKTIDDGKIFEKFASNFLSAVLGYEFIPVGGLKDKGIDGFEFLFYRKNYKHLYQYSIESNSYNKIIKTFEALDKNKIEYDSLCYVTNKIVKDKDIIVDKLFDIYEKPIRIYDLEWFIINATYSSRTINIYKTFILNNLHEFNKPGKSFVISNLLDNPTLYVFLRQQLEYYNREELKLDELLADTLILYSLENTDPDKEIFKTASEIKDEIRRYVKFDPKILDSTIDKRLNYLSKKPRKIQYHSKAQAFCLPFETRLEIKERNIKEKELMESFHKQTEEILRIYLKKSKIRVQDISQLINDTIHRIFYKQGLDFSNFILHNESKQTIEQDLPQLINQIVEESAVVQNNKEEVKKALLITIREIIYQGNIEQKKYLESLSKTYMMMFMLQWEPKIATYFESMASKLKIFVCNSIIIPALSEYYLSPENRRYWNLLVSAKNAGINLYINETIVNELTSHFKKIQKKYVSTFIHEEKIYLKDENMWIYIDEILIRAYFYAKKIHKVSTFKEFLEEFFDSNFKNIKEDLILYLSETFGIKYLSYDEININIDKNEETLIFEKLKEQKTNSIKAINDTKLILTVYKLREKNNELASGDIFGYRTWWLSTDTTTYKAVSEVLEKKYNVSCYIRPDFLYSYITLAPKLKDIDEAYKQLFPNLIGVNLSYHLPPEITRYIQKKIAEYNRKKGSIRIQRMLKNFSEKLKSDFLLKNRKFPKHFLEEIERDINM